MISLKGLGSALVVFGLICAVAGWGFISLILWLLSFVHISFGG